jgi:hypothetical protein
VKKLILGFIFAFLLFSCKVYDNMRVDTIANSEKLKEYQTFKVVDDLYPNKRNEVLSQAFREGLIDRGFEETGEAPDFLVQAVFVTKGLTRKTSYSQGDPFSRTPIQSAVESFSNVGLIGKAIFLIQDTETNEISWMGVGTGVSYGIKQINEENLDIALDELLATLN